MVGSVPERNDTSFRNEAYHVLLTRRRRKRAVFTRQLAPSYLTRDKILQPLSLQTLPTPPYLTREYKTPNSVFLVRPCTALLYNNCTASTAKFHACPKEFKDTNGLMMFWIQNYYFKWPFPLSQYNAHVSKNDRSVVAVQLLRHPWKFKTLRKPLPLSIFQRFTKITPQWRRPSKPIFPPN